MSTIRSGWQALQRWRRRRPFWGATLLLLSGLIILWIPAHLYEISLVPGSTVFVGFFFGGMVLLMAILSYAMPRLATLFGIIGMFSAILSIMGALGGFLVGTILGIIGGALCIAWRPQWADSAAPLAHSEAAADKEATNVTH
ncbi:hypothetical protein GTCCBUS3UF5_34030 [Geobacillus thermoleovorans CCB_US3_UF5]|nr:MULTISPECIES: DUF6114 domain-containing protein [Geobacillus]AEV20704.1 hypothetical protein GTCCBUS3UF5_34030 [Geobacillus thermoleovorans CCB_US3_UF5]AOL35706.1 hypothetical protein BGM21_15080 [Geobacillus thermoleovorans]AUI37278.1 hypothetical protein CWI35_12810 [[Bacillus] caldolyticus]EQB96551.1 hypothetical protein GA8_05200 [Geobacillus sp. A8]MED4971661.1 DUF6114 domain-containing protein [Geobacillus thermoleovorans]